MAKIVNVVNSLSFSFLAFLQHLNSHPPPNPGFIFVSSARLPCRFQTPPGTETGPVKEESQTPGRNPFYMGQSDVCPCVFVLLPWEALTGRSRGTESKACGFLEGDATEASLLQAWQMEVQLVVGVTPRVRQLGLRWARTGREGPENRSPVSAAERSPWRAPAPGPPLPLLFPNT